MNALPPEKMNGIELDILWEQFTRDPIYIKSPENAGQLANLKTLFLLAANQPGIKLDVDSNPLQIIVDATSNLDHDELRDLFPRNWAPTTLESFLNTLEYDKQVPNGIGSRLAEEFIKSNPIPAAQLATRHLWS